MRQPTQTNNFIIVLLLTAILSFEILFANIPNKNIVTSNSFFENMQKGYLTPLVTDFIWLDLTKKAKDDTNKMLNSTKIVAQTDPFFFDGINYGALYLAAVLDLPDDAIRIIDTAQIKNHDTRLNVLKLNILIIYKKDSFAAMQLAKQLLISSKIKDQKPLGDNFLSSLLIFGATSEKIKAQNIHNLEFLLKTEQNNKRKIKIKEKLDVLLRNCAS